jgi:hypothetical protein
MRKYAHILVLLALIAWVAAYLFEPYFDAAYWFTLDALAKAFLSGAVALVMTGYTANTIAVALFILACSNLTDELFFDPTVTNWNEYAFGALVIGYSLYRIGFAYGKPTT